MYDYRGYGSLLAFGYMAMAAQLGNRLNEVSGGKLPYKKTNLSNKQIKKRKASKQARKSRKNNR